MLGRILRSADFVRVLDTPACARSPHFAVHYLAGRPSRPSGAGAAGVGTIDAELCTDGAPCSAQAVDDSNVPAAAQAWLGTVVPKRHAKRAVTRTLIKRQIRAAVMRRGLPGDASADPAPLRSGLWVVRLRSPFERAAFPSAASGALRETAGREIDALLGQALRKLAAAPPLPAACTGT